MGQTALGRLAMAAFVLTNSPWFQAQPLFSAVLVYPCLHIMCQVVPGLNPLL